MAGIYLHIPFCKQACHYCNFHFSTSLKLKDEMLDAMLKELEIRSKYLDRKVLDSIYFGGGTPSILSQSDLYPFFDFIYKNFQVSPGAEITIEANPDDLSKEKLRQLSQSPINRLSIGVQSFHEAELVWMNRAHNAEESINCLHDAKSLGFDNISMDLIFGIPKSSHQLWEENLRRTIDLGIPHISAYALTVEEGTALGTWVEKGREVVAKDEYLMEQFDMTYEALTEAGYIHYEISNYALSGREAVHNSNYWKAKHYLGIGPSAHSFNGASRNMNIANNAKYIKAIKSGGDFTEREVLSIETKYNEYVMTRLRTIWGIDERDLGNFLKYFKSQIRPHIDSNWVFEEQGIYRLSKEGKHYCDAIASDLFYLAN